MILTSAMKMLPFALFMMLSPVMASEVLGTTIKTHEGNLWNKANQEMTTKAIPTNEMVDKSVLKTNSDIRNKVQLDGSAIAKELEIDPINQIQLEDQEFWERSLSMSHLGDEKYCVRII